MKPIIISLLPLVLACSGIEETDNYFNFPVQEISLPESGIVVEPERMSDDFSSFSGFWVEDSLFAGSFFTGSEDVVMAGNVVTSSLYGRFGRQGRGPQDFLSPVAYELNDGHLLIFDIMTSKVSDLDLKRSIEEGSAVFSGIHELDKGENSYLPLTAIHRWNDRFLAYDTGNDPMSEDLYSSPDYVLYDLATGAKLRNYHLFASIPLSNKKKEENLVKVKARLALSDCTINDRTGICFVMKYIPQINYFFPETGEVRGFRVTELSDKSLMDGYIHYNSVCSYGNAIYALYSGGQLSALNRGEALTEELHVFDLSGHIMQRILLDGVYVDCRASSEGLFLSRVVDDGADVGLFRIRWDSLPLD